MHYKHFPREGSRTERRKLRQEIRHRLGTSRDSAPTLADVFTAALELDRLLNLTTNGEFRLHITEPGEAGLDGPLIPGRDQLNEAAKAWRD